MAGCGRNELELPSAYPLRRLLNGLRGCKSRCNELLLSVNKGVALSSHQHVASGSLLQGSDGSIGERFWCFT